MLSVSASEFICLEGILLFTMKALLGSLLLLGTFMTARSVGCYFLHKQKGPNGSPAECKDLDGTTHPLNSNWKNGHCEECFCGENEVKCCSTAPIPVDYDRSKCRAIFHKENCTYSVVEKKDPGRACEVHEWIL